ncbi:MAG: hypothetical protein CMM47_02695 [Rhodospirillaceae bacterium]|nr:hypothetical protein [Rhodospirillaceae bacterium]
MRRTIAIATMIIAIIGTKSGAALESADRIAAAQCETAARKIEIAEAIPKGLLFAISLKESGRWDPVARRSVAWPWTVSSGGPGVHHATKEEALAAVSALRDEGRSNIDVGCFQINLRYHPHAFRTLEDAFDPATNAGYAGAFLRQLREDHGSWPKAVARYHTSENARGNQYRVAVYKLKSKVTNGKLVTTRSKSTIDWMERRDIQRRKFSAAKKARLANLRNLHHTKVKQAKRLRAAFEERRAKVIREWEEMMRKRRGAGRRSRS